MCTGEKKEKEGRSGKGSLLCVREEEDSQEESQG